MHQSEHPRNAPNNALPVSATATVFYDGQCPLCRREIAHYRRLKGANALHWLDITKNEASLVAHGLDLDTAMARFHVLDASGRWQTGAWGFVEMWSHLPAYRWLARALRALRLVPLLDWAYEPFARWRVRRSCNTESCNTLASIEETGSRDRSTVTHGARVGPRAES